MALVDVSTDDVRAKIDLLAELMREFGLVEASLSGDDWHIRFGKAGRRSAASEVADEPEFDDEEAPAPAPVTAAPDLPQGFPVRSPMQGIFYLTSSPGSPPFVKEGDDVAAGQVVGLIEAMKVFNEITAPIPGRVTKITKKGGDLIQPGEPLLYIG
ncbi:MAG: hypothetical protein KIS66_16940 [Fimbriimonadaceae bacterium]|nr:hypothetical protein [Fimbriimonadaceae bacterium]